MAFDKTGIFPTVNIEKKRTKTIEKKSIKTKTFTSVMT